MQLVALKSAISHLDLLSRPPKDVGDLSWGPFPAPVVAMPRALKQPAVPHGVQVFVDDEPIDVWCQTCRHGSGTILSVGFGTDSTMTPENTTTSASGGPFAVPG